MNSLYYHASQIGDIKVLEPRVSNHNMPLIYFSTKREKSIIFNGTLPTQYTVRKASSLGVGLRFLKTTGGHCITSK